MSEKRIYTKAISHYDNDKDWNPGESGRGTDVHTFTVPRGEKYTRYSVDVITATLMSGYEISSKPKPGAKGKQTVKVKWWYNPFGKIRYRLNVYAGNSKPLVIYFGENNWENKVKDAINQGLKFTICLRGPKAKDLAGLLNIPLPREIMDDPNSDTDTVRSRDAGTVTLGVTALLAVVAIAAFATIGGVLIYAINNGYEARARHRLNGPLPFDDELLIEVIPPRNS